MWGFGDHVYHTWLSTLVILTLSSQRWRWASRRWWQWWFSSQWSFPAYLPLERDPSSVSERFLLVFNCSLQFSIAGVFFAITLIMTTVITLLEAVITRMYRTARPLPAILKMPTRSSLVRGHSWLHIVNVWFYSSRCPPGHLSSSSLLDIQVWYHRILNHHKLQTCRHFFATQTLNHLHLSLSFWPTLTLCWWDHVQSSLPPFSC